MRLHPCSCVLVALALLSFLAPHASGLLLRQATPVVVHRHAFATTAAQILALPLDRSAMRFARFESDQSTSFDAQGVGGFGPGLPPPPPFPFFGGGSGHHGHGGGGGAQVTPLPLVVIRPVTLGAQAAPQKQPAVQPQAIKKHQPVIDVDVMVPQIIRQTIVQPYVHVNTVVTQVPVNEYEEAAPITEKARVINQGTLVEPTVTKKGSAPLPDQQPTITLVPSPTQTNKAAAQPGTTFMTGSAAAART